MCGEVQTPPAGVAASGPSQLQLERPGYRGRVGCLHRLHARRGSNDSDSQRVPLCRCRDTTQRQLVQLIPGVVGLWCPAKAGAALERFPVAWLRL